MTDKQQFEFETDSQSQQFCEGIAREMAARFGITLKEAVRRINYLWVEPFLGEDDMRYHDLESGWANHIYSWFEERLANGTADWPRAVVIARFEENKRALLEQMRKWKES